jgi:hypothetical protein
MWSTKREAKSPRVNIWIICMHYYTIMLVGSCNWVIDLVFELFTMKIADYQKNQFAGNEVHVDPISKWFQSNTQYLIHPLPRAMNSYGGHSASPLGWNDKYPHRSSISELLGWRTNGALTVLTGTNANENIGLGHPLPCQIPDPSQ